MPKIILRQTKKMINVLKGDFTGEFDLSVQDQNGFYNDYIDTENVITDLSIAVDPKLGAIATVRIIGGSLASDAIPTSWNFSGDVISQDEAFYNEIIILYVSSTDIRIVNRLVDAPDLTAPVFSVAPTATNITETLFDITATLNENGTVYGYLVGALDPKPTRQEIIDNAQSQFNDSGSGGALSFTGLTNQTNYKVYVLAVDTAGNRQADSTLVEVFTENIFDLSDISLQHLWHKFDVANTDADIVTESYDSLTTTPYTLFKSGAGTISRSTLDSKECINFSNAVLATAGVFSTVFLNSSFTISLQASPNDGRPTGTQLLVHTSDGAGNNRLQIGLNNQGKLFITIASNGNSVTATTVDAVFADGAQTAFKSILYTVESQGTLNLYIDGVNTSLTANDLSAVDLSQINTGSGLIIGSRSISGSLDLFYSGRLRQFAIQPVIYTNQQIQDAVLL